MAQIDKYLEPALKQNASDLHFVSGDPIRARVHGNLAVIMEETLKTDMAEQIIFEIMDGITKRTFDAEDAADFAYEIPDVSRFRVNAFRHLNGIGAIFRAIPSTALTLVDLNSPVKMQESKELAPNRFAPW